MTILTLALAAFVTSPAPDTLFDSFSDGTFSDSVWDIMTVEEPDSYVSVACIQSSTGGNPDYRRLNNIAISAPRSQPAKGGIIAMNTFAVYTPPADLSRFHHVKYRHDKLGDMVFGHRLLIEQDGVYFIGPEIPAPSNPTIWETMSNAENDEIEAHEFDEFDIEALILVPDSTLEPDFDSGTAITFGYFVFGHQIAYGAVATGTISIDNWSVEIYGN